MIDHCLGIPGVGLLSTIVAAQAVNGVEAVSIVMGLLGVVGNQAIKKFSLKIEKHEKIAVFHHLTLSVVSFQRHYQMTPI